MISRRQSVLGFPLFMMCEPPDARNHQGLGGTGFASEKKDLTQKSRDAKGERELYCVFCGNHIEPRMARIKRISEVVLNHKGYRKIWSDKMFDILRVESAEARDSLVWSFMMSRLVISSPNQSYGSVGPPCQQDFQANATIFRSDGRTIEP